MRVVSNITLSLVSALMVGACADPPSGPASGGTRLDDRWVPAPHAPGLPRPAAGPDGARWHLWVASPWSMDAVHDPWSPEAKGAERWFFGPIADVAPTADGILVALEAGAVVSMDASLRVTAVHAESLSRPRAIALDDERIFVADAELGLFAFRSTALGVGSLGDEVFASAEAWTDLRPHGLVSTPVGLFAAVAAEKGDEVVHLDGALSVVGRWRSTDWARIEDIGYGPDGAIYVVDGGPCVFMHDNPEHLDGTVVATRSFCRPDRAYHAVLPVEDGDGYLAHEDGIDVFAEISTVEDHVTPRHVLLGPDWPMWHPRHLAHGWAD